MNYTTTDLVSAQIGGIAITSSSVPSITDVEQWITEAEGEIDSRTGLTFKPSGFDSEVYDWEGNDDILRTSYEIVKVDSLYYNSESPGETPNWVPKVEDTDFYVYGESGEIEFIRSKFSPLSGKKRFKITGTQGKTTVPPVVQRLATLLVGNRLVETIVQNQAFANSGGDVQVGTIKVGNPSAFSVSAVNNAKAEINDLYTKVIGEFRSFRITRAYDL